MKPNRTHPKARRRRAMARERTAEQARVHPDDWSTGSTDPVAVEVERHIPLQPWSPA